MKNPNIDRILEHVGVVSELVMKANKAVDGMQDELEQTKKLLTLAVKKNGAFTYTQEELIAVDVMCLKVKIDEENRSSELFYQEETDCGAT